MDREIARWIEMGLKVNALREKMQEIDNIELQKLLESTEGYSDTVL